MYSFKFRKDKIILDYKFYMFDEFMTVWKDDKTITKETANKNLHFIFLLCDITEDNSIRDVDSNLKEEEAKFKAYHDRNKIFTKVEMKLIEPAIKMYIKINMTPEERLLDMFDMKAEELIQMLNTIVPETVTNIENGVTTFATNSKIITDTLTKLAVIRKNRAAIMASIKKEAMSEQIRGKLTLSPLSRGLINLQEL